VGVGIGVNITLIHLHRMSSEANNTSETCNSPKRTRFPPEPNGYLHLGHLKAMMFDFEYHPDCECILRLDDTNPETEKAEYVKSIIEDVEWLGFKPSKVTYTSDYFMKLWEFAIDLINADKAYVDLTPPETIKIMRNQGIESNYRSYPSKWHLDEFEKMHSDPNYPEDYGVLRLKIDMQNVNHTLRDPIAYRVRKAEHYRTGKTWQIYPTYDYSHGIVDALEKISHSYCTMEFYVRREQYYWPVKQLGLEPAMVQEFGRLNVENNVLSKRKIIELVQKGQVTGFDDARLLTIRGLRKRGFTAEILRNIVSHCSMDRHDNNLEQSLIDYHLREVLTKTAHRAFAVIDPIKLEVVDHVEDRSCEHASGTTDPAHLTTLSKEIWIENSDFREEDEKSYFRLAPGKTIRLRYADFVEYVGHAADFVQVKNIIPANPKKIKGVIHWVSVQFSKKARFELFTDLLEEGHYNEKSKKVKDGYVEDWVANDILSNPNPVYQFERLGYFKYDRTDSTDNVPVFIQVVSLVDKNKAKIEPPAKKFHIWTGEGNGGKSFLTNLP
jgi:glutaminyl-tRNA synthetase